MKILIVYGSSEGQTEKIARHIAQAMDQFGHQAVVHSLKNPATAIRVEDFQGVIVGAPVRMGKHPGYVVKFVRQQLAALRRLPNAFFSVCMAAYDPSHPGRQETQQYITNFLQHTGWTPDQTASFAGAVAYTKYSFLVRWVMKSIAKRKTLSTDTSRDHEYTDWHQVDQFAQELNQKFNQHLADTTQPPD